MTGKRKYVISFSGLSIGKHEYEYHLGDTFFEELEYSEIKKGDIRIDVHLHKQSALLILHFLVRGKVTVPCDRCGDDCVIPVKGEYQMDVKLGGEAGVDDKEDLVVLSANAGELNLAHHLYEYALLSLPAKRVHTKLSDCNPDAIKKLKEIKTAAGAHPADPRWELLRDLKFNN
jgi:uncharacterized protein